MLAFLLAMLLPAFVSADAGDACNAAIGKYRAHLDSLPKACKTDQDCVAAYAGIQYCGAPVFLAKSVNLDQDTKAKSLRDEMGKACQAIWAVAGACPRREANPTCLTGQCANGTAARHRE